MLRVSDADVAREEQAFRDAIRRIEFADEDAQPTLVPADEPVEEAPHEPRLAPVWPPPRSRRPETRDRLDAVDRPAALDGRVQPRPFRARHRGEPVIRLSEPRSLTRRVGERLALAAVVLVLAGVGLWMAGDRQDDGDGSVCRARRGRIHQPAPADNAAEAKAQQPNWLSPEMFYTPPMMPVPSPAPPSAARRAPTCRCRRRGRIDKLALILQSPAKMRFARHASRNDLRRRSAPRLCAEYHIREIWSNVDLVI